MCTGGRVRHSLSSRFGRRSIQNGKLFVDGVIFSAIDAAGVVACRFPELDQAVVEREWYVARHNFLAFRSKG